MTENTFYDSKPELRCRNSHYMCCNSLHIITSLRTHQRRKKIVLRLFFSLWFYMLRFGPVKKDFPLHSCFRGAPRRYSLLLTIFFKNINRSAKTKKTKAKSLVDFLLTQKKISTTNWRAVSVHTKPNSKIVRTFKSIGRGLDWRQRE